MILTRDKGKRMWGGIASSMAGGTGGSGGSGSGGYSMGVSIPYFEQCFGLWYRTTVIVTNDSTSEEVSRTVTLNVARPNEIVPVGTTTETDTPEAGKTTTTIISLVAPEAYNGLVIGDGILRWDAAHNSLYVEKKDGTTANFYATGGVSALGYSGGGGGGITLVEPLLSINNAGLGAPGAGDIGKAIVWTANGWAYATAGGGSTAWNDITGKPTTIAGYGITDAYISNGTIVIGSNSITPLVAGDLNGYATQTWVNNQGFLTQHQTVSGTFWGQSWQNGGTITGDLLAGAGGGTILQFHGIELNSVGSLDGYGGYIDFHYKAPGSTFDPTIDYTSRIIEEVLGQLRFVCPNGIRLGNGILKWDSTHDAFYIEKFDGTAANFYATGGVSALGYSGGGAGTTANNGETKNFQMAIKSDGANQYWHKLGSFTFSRSNMPQVLVIDLYTGDGFNGFAYQNSWAKIMLKDGFDNAGEKPFGVTCDQYGNAIDTNNNNANKILVRAVATTNSSGEIWVKCPWNYPSGAYTVSGTYESWLHNDSTDTDAATGPTASTVTGYYNHTATPDTTE